MPLFLATNIVFQAYNTSSWANKGVVMLLLALSVYTWATIISKSGELKIMARKNLKMSRQLHGRAHPAQLYIEAAGKFAPGIPIATVYTEVMKSFMSILRKKGVEEPELVNWQPGAAGIKLTETEMASLRTVAESELSQQLLLIESRMSMLATCTSTAPSLGLFGTVWGIMESFMAMANSGSSLMVMKVAPGIAGALLAAWHLGMIAPVPLVKRDMAVGHDFVQTGGRFLLQVERAPWWQFWRDHSATVQVAEGARLYGVTAVFAPLGVAAELEHRWEFREVGGWRQVYRDRFRSTGGRERGFRGYSWVLDPKPGEWRFTVATGDGRTIGILQVQVRRGAPQLESLLEREF